MGTSGGRRASAGGGGAGALAAASSTVGGGSGASAAASAEVAFALAADASGQGPFFLFLRLIGGSTLGGSRPGRPADPAESAVGSASLAPVWVGSMSTASTGSKLLLPIGSRTWKSLFCLEHKVPESSSNQPPD